jgi:hypothetical protein
VEREIQLVGEPCPIAQQSLSEILGNLPKFPPRPPIMVRAAFPQTSAGDT